MYTRIVVVATMLLGMLPAHAHLAAEYAYKGVQPTAEYKQAPFHGATPVSISGGMFINTEDLARLITNNQQARVIDVLPLPYTDKEVIDGNSYWLPGLGDPAVASQLLPLLHKAAANKTDPVVFYCQNIDCWLSYNAALLAIRDGYQQVYWYRGGLESWVLNGHHIKRVSRMK